MLASIPLSKSYLSSTSLNQPVLNKDLQASVNFETKSADIATLNNNKFFIKFVGEIPKKINTDDLTKDTQELASYRRDIEKIEKIYTDTVQDMTDKGERINPLLGNNFRRNIEGLLDGKASDYDPDKAFHHLQCYEQTDKVINRLNEQKDTFENNWKFDDVSNYSDWRYTHTWGRASPDNDKIPFIYLDPFWNKIKESSCQCDSRDACAVCQP